MTEAPSPTDPARPPTPPAPSHTARWIAGGIGAAALLVLIGYGAAVAAVSGQEVAAGTTVAGVDIGGMSADEAVSTLRAELGDAATAPIPVTAGEATTEIDPAAAGLSVDWRATVDQASGLVLNPAMLYRQLRGDVAVEPVIRTDAQALAEALAPLAEVSAQAAVEPTLAYSDQAEVLYTPGTPGAQLDVEASSADIEAAYLGVPYQPLALPMTQVAASVSDQEAQRVRDEIAAPAVSAPVTVRVTKAVKVEPTASPSTSAEPSTSDGAGSTSEVGELTIPTAVVAGALTFEPSAGTLVPTLNGKKVHRKLADELADVERPGTDARVVIRKGKPVIVKSKAGLAVDPDALSTAVLAVLPATATPDRVAVVAMTASDPDFTTADAKALNITEKLSSFRQWFPPAAYRWQNVGQAAEYLNGTIIEPGETFSMNDTIHERTRANGYTEGYIISGGRFAEELGGGVSIITTATWTAGFYAGLERVEQHPHGLYISRYQAGLEATVAWGLLDLRMRNETGNGVLITATRYSDGVLIEMWGTKKFDKVTSTFTNRYNYTGFQTITDDAATCVASEGVQGFSIAVTRRRYIDGKAVSTETFPTIYKPTPHVVCTNPAAG